MSGVISTLSSIGMAVGIVKKKLLPWSIQFPEAKSSSLFLDVCGVVLIANIIRIFFWLGSRFETPLLVQSLLLIIAHLFLLSLCLHYAPHESDPSSSADYAPVGTSNGPPIFDEDQARNEVSEEGAPEAYEAQTHRTSPIPRVPTGRGRGWMGALTSGARGTKGRPWDFWQWSEFGSYLEFMAGLIVILGILQVIFGRWWWYIDTLGFIALTIESTLPIPQFISNYRRKSCYGLRMSTLAGWLGGDIFKTVYFFLRAAPIQFKVTAIMTVCWDIGVGVQRYMYGAESPLGARDTVEESRGLRVGG